MYVCIYVYMYVSIHVCMYVCVYVCMYVCMCVLLRMRVYSSVSPGIFVPLRCLHPAA